MIWFMFPAMDQKIRLQVNHCFRDALEEGYAAARECAIIILGALKDTFGSLDNIRIIKAFGLVNCAEEFYDVEKVFDGFSDTIAEVLEERGYHARTVMGTHNLPNGNIPVEIEVIAEVR